MTTDASVAIRLIPSGLDRFARTPGVIDGQWGVRTVRALKQLIAANGRSVSVATLGPLPCITEAKTALGRNEARDNTWLMHWLKCDGRSLGDAGKNPWCGDFVETCIRMYLSDEPMLGALSANSYWARNWKHWPICASHLDDRSIGNGPVRFMLGALNSAQAELSTIGRHWEGWNTRSPKILGLLILAAAVLTRPKSRLLGSSTHLPRAIQWSKPTVPTPAACAVDVIDGQPALKGAQMKRDRPTCIKTTRNDIADNTL